MRKCSIVEYYPAIKKKEILPFVTRWMDLKGIILSEVNQTERDKYSVTYMLNLINESQHKTQTL